MNNSLSEKLLRQIYNFANLTQRGYHQEHLKVNDLNIGHAQGHLLGILLTHDGLTQKELSMELQIRPASLGELVDKLERNGYVERRVNENDKRVSNVYLKEEGRTLVNTIIKSRSSKVDDIFSGLSEDEKNQLSALMVKLMGSIRENSMSNTDGFDDGEMSHHGHHRMDMEDKDFTGRPHDGHQHDHHENQENHEYPQNDRGRGNM